MLNIEKVLYNERQFKPLISHRLEEVEVLLRPFRHRRYQYHKHFEILGKWHKKPLSAQVYQHDLRTLNSIKVKLMFILLFFKTNPIQPQLAVEFDMDQDHVSRWIKVLLALLNKVIVDCHCQAAHNIVELIRLFRQRKGSLPVDKRDTQNIQILHVDFTAHPIGRNVEDEAQRVNFSSKQHGYRIKNTMLPDEYQFIHFADLTWHCSKHDKTMVVEELPELISLQCCDLWFGKETRPPMIYVQRWSQKYGRQSNPFLIGSLNMLIFRELLRCDLSMA